MAETREGQEPDHGPETEESTALAAVGPPFGPAFFMNVLNERVQAECRGRTEDVPVVELHLAGGYTLDLCHVPGIEAQWLAAYAYRDRETCDVMDLMFVPYGLITRVTVSLVHRSERPVGFQVGATQPAVEAR